MDLSLLRQGVKTALHKLARGEYAPEFQNEHDFVELFEPLISALMAATDMPSNCGSANVLIGCLQQKKADIVKHVPMRKWSTATLMGAGAFGQVWRLSSQIAVKIERLDNPIWQYVFPGNNAIDILTRSSMLASHAGDVGAGPRIFGHYPCVYNNLSYFVTIMELLIGSTAATWIRSVQSRPDWLRLHRKFQSMFEAAHDKLGGKIVHNDLHFENVFVIHPVGKPEKIDGVKIIDFGLAQLTMSLPETEKKQFLSMMAYDESPIEVIRHLVRSRVIRLCS